MKTDAELGYLSAAEVADCMEDLRDRMRHIDDASLDAVKIAGMVIWSATRLQKRKDCTQIEAWVVRWMLENKVGKVRVSLPGGTGQMAVRRSGRSVQFC